METYLQAEEYAYPHGGQTRKGRAIMPDGSLATVYAGIPDTFFTIPAHARIAGKYAIGYLSLDDDSGEWCFRPYPPRDKS